MLSLVKYCSTKHVNRNVYRPFCKFISNAEYDNKQFKTNRRVLSTKAVVKPGRIEFPKEVKDEFVKILPVIIKDLTESETYLDMPDAMKRFSDVLNYHLPFGSHLMGLWTLLLYKTIEKPENLTADNMKLGTVLAWTTELLSVSVLLIDDVMNNSETRLGSPCWYRVDGIGMTAVNDSLFLENSAYTILKKYFSTHPKYIKLMETTQEGYLNMICGQCLDTMKPKLEEITMDRFNKIAMYKGSQIGAITPTRLAMHLSNTYSDEADQIIRPIMDEICRYATAENDIWDCYGDTRKYGKEGNEIQEGKCTWLAVVALQEANPSQRKIMEEHYGRLSNESVQIIRKLYDELDILGKYEAFRKETQKSLFKHIVNLPPDNPMCKAIFRVLTSVLELKNE